MYATKLQVALGVLPDGILGRGTLTALFKKCGARKDRASELALAANVLFKQYAITDDGLRLAHFMAQVMHESGNFRYMEEIASGKAYEGRKDLGNTRPGDGRKYKGRGPIQLTGRANYREFGRILGIDFERNPTLVAVPSIGLRVALEFWRKRGLNAWADLDNIKAITKRINGGLNGIRERKNNLRMLKELIL